MVFQNKPIKIGQFVNYSFCRFCLNPKLIPVIDLGNMPLAGGFLKKDVENEKFFPLILSFCTKCYLLQSINVINQNDLFKNYFYFSSKINTLVDFFEKQTEQIKHEFKDTKKRFLIEIGCNDGMFLRKASKIGFKTLGVDPAKNVVRSTHYLKIINDFFTKKLAVLISNKYGKADVICSFNTLAHIEDMNDVIEGIKLILKDDGILYFGIHYLGDLIAKNQYDMIYHEHQYYYSVLTLNNFFNEHGMEIYNIKKDKLHEGSILVFVQKKNGPRKKTEKLEEFMKLERKLGFHKASTYLRFMKNILKSKKQLQNTVKKIKKQGKKIAGYGASGRGTIIMNFCDLDQSKLDFVIDDSEVKQGLLTPGNHLKIVSSNILKTSNRPDYVLLFAWAFIEEIMKKNKNFLNQGGIFIKPLPKIQLIHK